MKNRKYFAIIIFFAMACLPSALQADELSFESTQYYGTGAWPCGITVGDLDNDGYHDIVTANYDTDNVSIFSGNGDGTFQAAVSYGAGDGPYAPAIGYFEDDGNPNSTDGNPDIAVVNGMSNSVSVLLGNGNGTFQTAVNYAVGTYPTWVSVGDINGDNYPDMVTANSGSNTISVLLNNANDTGTFQTAINYTVVGEPLEVEIYDLDNDGDQDVAVACYSGDNMAVLLNDGSGALGSAVYYTAGDGTRAAAVGDLNRDGAPDIVTGNYTDYYNYVTVLLGNGDGTFQSPVNYTSGNNNTRSVALIDFNNDGFHDIAVTNYNEGTLSVLLGNGDGTFQAAIEYAADATPHGIAVGDFNKDGKPDIATNNGDADNIAVLINNSVAGSNDGEAFVTTTQEYYTSGFPSPATFYFQTGNNVFEEADGTLHAAYIENYELYYLRSTDGGGTWTKENIASAHNGDVHSAALTVDHEGNVFIGFTAHDLFNYDNPPANNYGSEWYYDLYSVNNISGAWTEETVYTHVSNYGAKAMAMVVDGDNNVHLIANRSGWYTNGGTAWEWVRDSVSDTWGTQITAATITDENVDQFIYDYYRPLVDSDGTITLIMSRYASTSGDDDYLFYVQNDGAWSGITVIDQPNRDYAATYHFDAAIDGSDHIYLVYLKDIAPGVSQILFSTDFGATTPIYTGQSGERIYDLKLHSDSSGNLTLFIRRGLTTVQGSSISFLYPTSMATRPSGGSWSTFKSLPSSAPDGDVFYLSVAHTDTLTGDFNSAKVTYFDREFIGQTGPYGPDNLYFNNFSIPSLFAPQQIITYTADGIDYAVTADIDGDGDQDILASLRPGITGPCSVVWYENIDGAGNFGTQNLIATETSDRSASVLDAADIDGDGDIDVISGSPGDNEIFWYENTNGTGSFAAAVSVATADGGGWRVFVKAADIDGDGDQDIVSAEYGAGIIAWHENTEGDGSLWTKYDITSLSEFTATWAWAVHAADIDGDGDMDVLSAANLDVNDNDIAWYENTAGDGSAWTATSITTTAVRSRFVCTADIDGDNDLDVLSASWEDNKIAWYENTDGYGTFGSQQIITNTAYGTQVVNAADFDNDGDIDAVSAAGTYLNWYENISGDGASWTIHTIAIDEGYFAHATDLDGDGNIDLLSGNYNGDIITWYENLSTAKPSNSPPSAPTAVNPPNEAIITAGSVTLDASAFTDPDSGDSQVGSYWMIRRADSVYGRLDYDESFNFEAVEGDLTSHEVTGLSSGMKYVWKVGYVDSGSGEITWSDEYSFKVGESISEAMPEIDEGTDIVNYRMMSFPYWLDDPSALTVFDIEYDTRYYRIGHYEADRNSGEYVEVDAPGAEINPGEAIWVLAREGIDVLADGIPVSDAYDIEVPLRYNETNGNGWNQIGCPNAKEYMWGDIEVIEYSEYGEVLFGPTPISDLEQANEYIDIRIWEWVGGEYDSYTPDDEFILIPYEGYWVRARKANVHLNFPMSVQLTGSRVGGNVFAAYFDGTKRWLKDRIVATPLAVADSGDSPPMPMGAFTDSNESRASQGGCFIGTAAGGSSVEGQIKALRELMGSYIYMACYHPVVMSGLFVMLLGVIGLVLFHRPKNGLFRNRQRS